MDYGGVLTDGVDMLDLPRRARAAGLPTALVSDADSVPEAVAALFDVLVLGGAVGARKPDPEVYRRTAALLGLAPHDCVVVDDLASNVRGAGGRGDRGAARRAGHDGRGGRDPAGAGRLSRRPTRRRQCCRADDLPGRGQSAPPGLSPTGGSDPTGSSPCCWACGACGSAGGAPVSPGSPVIVASRSMPATNPSSPRSSRGPSRRLGGGA